MEWTLLTDLLDSIIPNHSQYAYQSIFIVLYYLQSVPLHCSHVIQSNDDYMYLLYDVHTCLRT